MLIVLGALLETEWVLRSRYKLDKASIAGAVTALLESSDVECEHPPAVEEALDAWDQHPAADIADCLLAAHAAHLGRGRFVSFDLGAARLSSVELLVSTSLAPASLQATRPPSQPATNYSRRRARHCRSQSSRW